MENLFVPKEEALALEKLGFKERCFAFYHKDKLYSKDLNLKLEHESVVNAPLYDQVFDWFREKHKLHFDLIFHTDYLQNGKRNVYEVNIENTITNERYLITPLEGFNDIHEAKLKCLKKLIELIS